MSNDDWIRKIRLDREAAEAKAQADKEAEEAQRHAYEARIGPFWDRFVEEVTRTVGVYNSDAKPAGAPPVVVERTSPHYVQVSFNSFACLQLCLNRDARQLSITERHMTPTGRMDDGPRYIAIRVTNTDLGFAGGLTLEQVIRGELELFFRLINRLR